MPNTNVYWVDFPEFEKLCHTFAIELLSGNEPIPSFETRYPHKLEGALYAPLQAFQEQDLYPDLSDKVTALFYFLIQDHPFQNGNKRIAVASLLVVLGLNDWWLDVLPLELYELAVQVAQSDSKDKDIVMATIKQTIVSHLVPLD